MNKQLKKEKLKDKITYWFRYEIPRMWNYVRSLSFMQCSYDVWKADLYISADRDYFINNREPDLMPYWSRVESDLNDILHRKGCVTCADYAEAQMRYRHIADIINQEYKKSS